MLMALECEKKFGKVAASCCTHPVTNLGKGVHHMTVRNDIPRSKRFDI
jgi:hypothetical protein